MGPQHTPRQPFFTEIRGGLVGGQQPFLCDLHPPPTLGEVVGDARRHHVVVLGGDDDVLAYRGGVGERLHEIDDRTVCRARSSPSEARSNFPSIT